MKPRRRSPGFEAVFQKLNELETIEAVAAYFDVSRRTIDREVQGRAELHYCWKRIDTVSTHARPADDTEHTS